MRILKRILLFIVSLIVLALVVALFVSKDINVNKEVVINKPKQEVFTYIKELKNQNNYAIWMKMDPNIKQTYTGTDGTVGFISTWDGNKEVGKGQQTITKVAEGEKLETELKFIEPFESVAKAFMTTTAVNDSTTKVNWGFESKMAYPMNIFKLFMSTDKMIGNDYQQGLDNLKKVLEK
jgi:uncharacterized protein YndB with AHSA1/START domain